MNYWDFGVLSPPFGVNDWDLGSECGIWAELLGFWGFNVGFWGELLGFWVS